MRKHAGDYWEVFGIPPVRCRTRKLRWGAGERQPLASITAGKRLLAMGALITLVTSPGMGGCLSSQVRHREEEAHPRARREAGPTNSRCLQGLLHLSLQGDVCSPRLETSAYLCKAVHHRHRGSMTCVHWFHQALMTLLMEPIFTEWALCALHHARRWDVAAAQN